MLKGQQAYGRNPKQRGDGVLALGRLLHPLLPEDIYDDGPIQRGDYSLAADVRLDNRDELAAAASIGSQQLISMSDSALLFECLLKWSEGAADRLVGEFAFAWWDSDKRRLMLCRDIFGHRPLYFHQGSDFLAFASMPSGLHSLPEIPRESDSSFMAESLALLGRSGRGTFFRGIERVEPAHSVIIDRSGVRSIRYWNPSPPVASRRARSDYCEEAREIVDKAVAAQLRGARSAVASHLSSGLDSSIVTTSAARQIDDGRVIAFTAVPRPGFDGPVPAGSIADEGPAAAAIASQYRNIEHVLVANCSSSLTEALDREHFYQQQPIANLENAVWGREITRAAQARGINVLLTGASGNLTISYAGLESLALLLSRGRVIEAALSSLSLRRNGVPLRIVLAQLIGPALPRPIWQAAARLRGWATLREYSALRPELFSQVQESARERGFDLTYQPTADPFAERMSIYSDIDDGNYLKGVLAEWGVSVRDPLSDKRVVEFCLAIPAEEFLRGGMPRSLARRAFADRLPASVRQSLERGYQSADWFEGLAADLGAVGVHVDAISRCQPAAETMDMEWLRHAIGSFPSGGWASQKVAMRFRYGLLRAVSAGHFMRKVAGSN